MSLAEDAQDYEALRAEVIEWLNSQPSAEPTEMELQQLRLAIADPGSVLPRAAGPELLIHWAARAVVAAGWRPRRGAR